MWTRRRILGTGALALPAFSLGTSGETCGLAIGTYGLQSMPLEEAIRLVAGTGYDAIEITTFPDSTGDPAGALGGKKARDAVRKLAADQGLRICALMVEVRPQRDDEAQREALETLRACIELSRDLSPDDPPLLQTVLGGKNWDESRELFRDRLAEMNQVLGDLKGYFAIKPHRGNAMSRPEDARWILEQLGNPRRLGMVYDYSHYAFRDPEMQIAETVEAAKGITTYVAVKDAEVVDKRVRFALAGATGSWDHAEVISGLWKNGYRGDFCCEVSSQIWKKDPHYDPVEATQVCYRNMDEAFRRASVPRG